ncbi:glycosyltransferase [Salinimicrobium oceani]|uniref:Glycosyltransferase n=1 Tax=Salinimicrobium oceani TaxID=2722702 RepID=A0ABX1D3X2_9FLAO|nr:glycosyltransferase [Salinimicrobium oceani]NJW54032.1 glycosyltransferase [Salinimicrobium oceani]
MKRQFNGEPRNKMRVLQLIDSLRSGGAERMSINYANALAKRIDASFLCCTRKEGLLKKQLTPEVGYLFLNKKSTLDLEALLKFRKFVKENKIDFIQAHSSSWFLALMVKLSLPKVKLIWHDHYGRDLKQRKAGLLKSASRFFNGIIAVNKDLEQWSIENLSGKEVRYIRNFLPKISDSGEEIELKGGDSFKIICVANFRPQKDHLNLLQAFQQVILKHPGTTLHLIGKEEQSPYFSEVRRFLEDNRLQDKVFFYGEQENISVLLRQANLGVLASASEGLPVALLEYGRAGIPVVCTAVGECAEVIGKNGTLVPPQNPEVFAEAIGVYLENEELLQKHSEHFKYSVQARYSEKVVLPHALKFFTDLNPTKFN